MDPAQLASAASKGVIPAVSKLGSVLGARLHKKHLTTLQDAVKAAATSVLASPLDRSSDIDDAGIVAFCQSPAFADACYQALLIEAAAPTHSSEEVLRDLINGQLQFYVARDAAKTWSPYIAAVLMQTASTTMSHDTFRGLLSESRLQAEAHARIVEQLLGGISHRLTIIEQVAKAYKQDDIDAFEKKYRSQVQARYRKLTPPNFGSPRSVPFSKVYVAPSLQCDENPISLGDFIAQINRTVVVGDPGGGKTTLATRIILDATRPAGLYGKNTQLTPFIVTLREYAARKDAQPMSIVEFLEETLKARFQMGDIPPRLTDFLLSTGRSILVFDGLDELLDTTSRREVVEDVELCCSLYSTSPALVTSRAVGYDEAPLDPELYQVFRLAKFSGAQVQEYAEKWFRNSADIPADERAGIAIQFIKESGSVADLTTNPLMLSLMCNLYRGERYIPRNRPELYEKCATLLFERWDKQRKIVVPLPIEAHVRPAMMAIAYRILESPSLQEGVPRPQLEDMAASYLLQAKYDKEERARSTASKFIDFCTGRAWVFTNTGSTESSELYQFTHRTFLEFFAAAHLARTRGTPTELAEILLPRVAAAEWDVVSQLAVQIMAKHLDGAADELLDLALEFQHMQEGRRRYNVLAFAARCLAFLVPREVTVRRVTSELVRVAFDEDVLTSAASDRGLGSRPSPNELMCTLFEVAEENHEPALEAVREGVSSAVKDGSRIALDFCSSGFSTAMHGERVSSTVDGQWMTSLREVARSTGHRLAKAKDALFLAQRVGAMNAFEAGLISASELLSSHHCRYAFLPAGDSAILADVMPEAVRFLTGRSRRATDGGVWDEWAVNVVEQVESELPPWFAVTELSAAYEGHVRRYNGVPDGALFQGLSSRSTEDPRLSLAELIFVLSSVEAQIVFGDDPISRSRRYIGSPEHPFVDTVLVSPDRSSPDVSGVRQRRSWAFGGDAREFSRVFRHAERAVGRLEITDSSFAGVCFVLRGCIGHWVGVIDQSRGRRG